MTNLSSQAVDERLFTRWTALAASALFSAFGVILLMQGRLAWCKHGFGVWADAWTHCTSQQLVDPYTLSHFLHGVIFFWLLRPLRATLSLHWRLIVALSLEIGWELFENSAWVIERYRQATASLDYVGDSIVNSMGDVVLTMAGFMVAARFSWKVSIGLFIMLELAALWMARDNLTLNLLMLLWPIEAIKEWQLRALG
jgi:Protein of unknown function (DUF2585)